MVQEKSTRADYIVSRVVSSNWEKFLGAERVPRGDTRRRCGPSKIQTCFERSNLLVTKAPMTDENVTTLFNSMLQPQKVILLALASKPTTTSISFLNKPT